LNQESVDEFKDKYEMFSNFYPVPVFYKGIKFPSVEHAYVAAKSFDRDFQKRVASIPVNQAGKAKRLGRTILLRTDWDQSKVKIMRELLSQKFSKETFKDLLLSTGNSNLTEGNWWHDNFWGDCKCKKCENIPGTNMLGKLLMEIREDLKNESNNNR